MKKLSHTLIVLLLMLALITIGACNTSTEPTEKTYRYAKGKGKVTFWTTWDQVNSNSIAITVYNTKKDSVGGGFLSQYVNYNNEPSCDGGAYGATVSFILPIGNYTYKAVSRNNYTWGSSGSSGFNIEEDGCLRYLLY